MTKQQVINRIGKIYLDGGISINEAAAMINAIEGVVCLGYTSSNVCKGFSVSIDKVTQVVSI
jgi:hypothetical protein